MKINSHEINLNKPCYLIAEISHNHQGNAEKAFDIIREAAANGASAIKFQKRDNKNLYLPSFFEKPYEHEHSFGKTYGEHRLFLEPKIQWLKKANQLTHELGLDFIMTVFDLKSLELCEKKLNVDAYKIQSADLTSHYLIEKIATTKKPFFMSCGASSLREIKKTYKFCRKLNAKFCLMYAVSEYPTYDNNTNIKRIIQLKKELKTDLIGFSCHNKSVEPAIYSRVLGTVAIEKHFTLNKNQKGPDHKISLMPKELKNLRKQLNQVDIFMGNYWTKNQQIEDYQLDARYKMGKCAISIKALKKGEILSADYIAYKSPMDGKNPVEVANLIGKKIKFDLKKGEVIK